MTLPRLSICIPIYNFGAFIGETLESIIGQATDQVEIVVVDGASTDNTADVVRAFHAAFPRLKYHRLSERGGVDRDLATTVEMARGEYCWLMSGDDVLKSGAIRRILQEIRAGHDIYLCNRTECDRALNPYRDRLWLAPDVRDQIFTFSKKTDFIDYFTKSRSIGALFSYISTIVVRRPRWSEIRLPDQFVGTHFAHAFRLFSILLDNGVLKYVRDSLVFCRGDNDSFLEQGVSGRYLIDFKGYLDLGRGLFPEAAVQGSFKKVMRREHPWYMLPKLRHEARRAGTWHEMRALLRAFDYSLNELAVIGLLGSSGLLMALAYGAKRFYRRLLLFRMSRMAHAWRRHAHRGF
ncbi:MAG: glycosyltransferase family 2 protein [Deltaproteobacteria bacterium]|nr:glycosyltransferase family 2 protein [Deltaproteobacteria bacterium]